MLVNIVYGPVNDNFICGPVNYNIICGPVNYNILYGPVNDNIICGPVNTILNIGQLTTLYMVKMTIQFHYLIKKFIKLVPVFVVSANLANDSAMHSNLVILIFLLFPFNIKNRFKALVLRSAMQFSIYNLHFPVSKLFLFKIDQNLQKE